MCNVVKQTQRIKNITIICNIFFSFSKNDAKRPKMEPECPGLITQVAPQQVYRYRDKIVEIVACTVIVLVFYLLVVVKMCGVHSKKEVAQKQLNIIK